MADNRSRPPTRGARTSARRTGLQRRVRTRVCTAHTLDGRPLFLIQSARPLATLVKHTAGHRQIN